MSAIGTAARALVIGTVATSAVLGVPIASADPGDVGVCARKNGQPFYIPPQGYMPQPGEVITGPVTAGPCQDAPSSSPPDVPSLPDLPGKSTSTTPTSPPPPPA